MTHEQIRAVARELVAPGKGILAADESFGTIEKRFAAINVPSTPESRRDYRDLLFSTKGVEEFLSGVILFDETIRQTSHQGPPFPALLLQKGILPGIKVDKGAVPLANYPGERITEGLDGLRGRLSEYRDLGARFTKWRAVIGIGEGIPTRYALQANARVLAHCAALSQEAGLTPIVEPEVLMEGDHGIERCEEVTIATLRLLFFELQEHRVSLDGLLLKPNMVLPGRKSGQKLTPAEVAVATLRALRQSVPAAVPGIVFLSGGQSPEQATANLNAMNRMGPHPWEVSFSFARALQEPPMRAWAGNPAGVPEAQRLFYHRARCNSAARHGRYSPEMERETSAA
ncbi:MAG: fructose-bisphosphate aldolase class I [Dehalococcoidia bacterium]|nr:fructose-bisphosphate aldolase class I [Dehalococcoidia bacterium]